MSDPTDLTSDVKKTLMVQCDQPCPPGQVAQRTPTFALEPPLLEEPAMAPEEEEEEEEDEDEEFDPYMEGRAVCWYDEMLMYLEHGIKPMTNLQQFGFTGRDDFPDTEVEFLKMCDERWKAEGKPICWGFWWGRAPDCSRTTSASGDKAQCENCHREHKYISNP